MLAAIGHALMMSFAMTWEILWALILGFGLSAIIQAVVTKEEMSRLLPDDSACTVAVACGLGAASSSCSYAAVALLRSMFRKGENFTAAMAFQLASTNLVVELGILLALLMDWQFILAEFPDRPPASRPSSAARGHAPCALLQGVQGIELTAGKGLYPKNKMSRHATAFGEGRVAFSAGNHLLENANLLGKLLLEELEVQTGRALISCGQWSGWGLVAPLLASLLISLRDVLVAGYSA